jgi:hypothetical protein
MKIFTAAAVAILLSSGIAYAQDTSTTTGSTQGSDSDPSNYLAGPNIHRFYTDESMTTLRPEAEIMSTWQGMSAEEQANLRQACQGNKDSRWSTLCNSIGTM